MKRAKMIIRRIFYPTNKIWLIIPLVSYIALIFIFAQEKTESMLAYPIYFMSAYSLKRLFLTALKNTKTLRLEESYDKMFQFVFEPILECYQEPAWNRRYIMAFYVQGLMAIITQWLKNDCKEPIEQIITVMQKCVGKHQMDEEEA